jgi:hypothetical protein
MLDYSAITLSYYEKWLGQQACLSSDKNIQFIYSAERNVQQIGYPTCIDMYCWIQQNKIVVSYGDKVESKIGKLKEIVTVPKTPIEMTAILSDIFDNKINHNIKYVHKGTNRPVSAKAKTLCANDYADYEAFFLRCFPGNNDWLQEYFDEMVLHGHCVGAYEDGIIVSCTDGPTMPYMSEKVQEIGINTLPEYGGRGYATAVCVKAAENILANGKVPQWSTGVDNIASQKLAESVGFAKISDILTVTL